MTVRDDFDRLLTVWLDETAGAGMPDYLDETLDGLARVSQRPVWMSPGRWLPMQLTMPRVAIPRALPILAAVAMLIAALIAAALLVGSRQPPLPPPFGRAATGMFVYDAGGDLYLAAVGGESDRPLVSDPGEAFGATFSRDGTRVAYWERPVPGLAVLRVVRADGTGARTIGSTSYAIDPTFTGVDWSPDGRHVAFNTNAGELYVVDVDAGANPTLIGDKPLARLEPAWSPDGSLIAFRGEGDPDVRGVYVIGADGTGEVRVTDKQGNPDFPERRPVWSPDGRLTYHVAVDGGRDNDIFVAERSADGWEEAEITFTPVADEPTLDSWPVWSNDGRWISFVRSVTDNNGYLMVAAADGSGARRVSDAVAGFSPACWTPDDGSIVVVSAELDVMIGDERETGYRVLSVDGSSAPVLIPTPGRKSFGACSWQRLAPDQP
jgi:hypothetical protein